MLDSHGESVIGAGSRKSLDDHPTNAVCGLSLARYAESAGYAIMRIAVIGGGPSGSVAAALLAEGGCAVDCYEREPFPRFHVGESLLPCGMDDLAAIGLDDTVLAPHFVRKDGATFCSADGRQHARFAFADGLPGDPDHAYQVERAAFDALLLERSAALGARLRQPCRVQAVDTAADGAVVHSDAGSEPYDFVIDASGRDALLARRAATIDRSDDLHRAAVYGHVSEVAMPAAAQSGDVVIDMADDGWAWQIPLASGRCSVGLVLDRSAFRKATGPAAAFEANLAAFPALAARLAAVRPDPVRATPDISYHAGPRYGERWALVGDAAGFVDPIFSSGIMLGTNGARRLAHALLRDGPDADLAAWDARCDYDLAVFTAFIRLWYQRRTLRTLFFAERREERIARGLVSLLAGNTQHPDNAFLAMLQRRMASKRGPQG